LLGYRDQALARAQENRSLAQTLSHPFSLGFALGHGTWVHQNRGEVQAAEESTEALIALANEQGFPHWLAWGTILHGCVLAEKEQVEGIAQIRQGLDHRAPGDDLERPYFLSLRAEAYGRMGQMQEGLEVLAEALNVADKTGERYYEAELYRLKGELLRQKAKTEAEAEGCFRQAMDIARRQSAKSLELRAAMNLCCLWQRQGNKIEARRLLAEIYGWFTEGFETFDLKAAKGLLEELTVES
jgi:predicted ATPase